MCPWAYQTSLWIRSVREETGLKINWKFFSLEEVNRREGKKHPWEREWSYGWSMMRIGAYLRRTSMDDLDSWYARPVGRFMSMAINPTSQMLHVTSSKKLALIHRSLMRPLPTSQLTMRYETTTIGLLPQAGTACPRSISMATAYLGLCFSTSERGGCCSTLGSGIAMGRISSPLRITASKTEIDERSIATTFRPYLEARDWVSINRGKVVPIGASSDEEAAS